MQIQKFCAAEVKGEDDIYAEDKGPRDGLLRSNSKTDYVLIEVKHGWQNNNRVDC